MKNPNQAKNKNAKRGSATPAQRRHHPELHFDALPVPGLKIALRGIGDLMEPEVFEGDRAVIAEREDMEPCAGELVICRLKTGESIFGIHDKMDLQKHRISFLKGSPRYFPETAVAWLLPVECIEMMERENPTFIRAFKRVEFNLE